MKRAPKTMMSFAMALIAVVIALQVAWAMIEPMFGYMILLFVIVAGILMMARAFKWFVDHR